MVDSQMQAIPIAEILSKTQVPVDYFLRLSADKYILVAKAGSNTPTDAIQKYKMKNVDRLFVRLEDYLRLLQNIVQSATAAVASKAASDPTKLAVIRQAMSAVYEESAALGFNEVTFSHAKLVNHATMTFIESNPIFVEMIARLAVYEEAQAGGIKHAMMVSLVSTMIGIGHDWAKPATLEKLALGGFLHDIGKIKLPEEIVVKQPSQLTGDERTIYHGHPEVGYQMLTSVKTVPEDVALMVLEHHELADGTGYPRGIKDFQISPLARIVSLANAFSEIVLQEAGSLGPNTALVALQKIEFNMAPQFNRDALKALRRLVKGLNSQAA